MSTFKVRSKRMNSGRRPGVPGRPFPSETDARQYSRRHIDNAHTGTTSRLTTIRHPPIYAPFPRGGGGR
jgi:hypothetical protein